jgi:hypothetical protein
VVIDLLSLILQDVVYAYVFTLKQNYLQYEMCYAFEIVTQLIPRNLYMIPQWLKVGQAFQRFIILSKPINYRAIFNGRSVVTFFIVIIVVSCSFSTVWFLLIDFERIVITHFILKIILFERKNIRIDNILQNKRQKINTTI